MRMSDCGLRIIRRKGLDRVFSWTIRNPQSAIGVCLFAATCTPATTRPDFAPFPQAQVVTVRSAFDHTTTFATRWLTAQGIRVIQSSPRDGYLETAWIDGVKVRCWVDPAATGQSRVTVEAAYRPMTDPSRVARDLERPVPPDRDGYRLAERLMTALSDSLGVIQ